VASQRPGTLHARGAPFSEHGAIRMDCYGGGQGVSLQRRMQPGVRHRISRLALPALVLAAPAGWAQQDPGLGSEAAATVSASDGPLALSWQSSDPSCDGVGVSTRALQLVREGVTPRPTQAHAQVAREGSHWLVELQTRSESSLGRRTLRGASCEEIENAIALVLAMMLESGGTAEAAPAASAPALGPSLDTGSPELDEAPPRPARPPPRQVFAGLVRADGIAAWGAQPSLGLGASGSVGVALGRFELLATGAYWPASRTAIFDRNGEIEMNRKMVGLTACYGLWNVGPLSLVPCLSPELMWLDWHSLGLSKTNAGQENHLGVLTAFVDLRFELIGPVFLSLAPGVSWERPRPFQAQRCQDCNGTDVFRTWSIVPRFGAGVGARF
jgi:hypothetical protein